jgi:diguanylate cyclase (GGDEF)-like protein
MIGFIIGLMLSLISYLAQIARSNANKAFDEIKTRKKTEQQLIVYSRKLKKQSLIDPLTGVHNRRSLSTILQQEIVHLKVSDMSLSVILLDIDHFKAINDTYGHVTGDNVLHKVGELLRKNSRSTDTVARYGGEEFFVVLRNTSDRQAYTIAEKLRRLIAEQIFLCEKKVPFHVTCSFGVYQIPSNERKITQVFEVVDGALYAAKNSGRNCVILV